MKVRRRPSDAGRASVVAFLEREGARYRRGRLEHERGKGAVESMGAWTEPEREAHRQKRLPFERQVEREFREWLPTADGQTVLHAATERSLRLLRLGFRHYSIDAIWQSIRYDRSIELGPDHGYKINDHHRAYMAREIMARTPELAGFFETRELRGR